MRSKEEKIKEIVEEKDFGKLHDIIYDLEDRCPSEEYMEEVLNKLSEHIIDDAVRWGLSDTPTADSIYEYLEENK